MFVLYMQLKDRFPKHFLDFVSQDLVSLKYFEANLDCGKCAFKSYSPSVKCCTFEPFVPNFIVGDLELRSGRNSLELPLGILPKPQFQVEFKAQKSEKFGRNEDWLCSSYDPENQKCRIWHHRGSTCVSFYCQSEKGGVGIKFWDIVSDLLSAIEVHWAMELLRRLDFGEDIIERQVEYLDFDEGLLLVEPKELWGRFLGRERELYFHVRDLNQQISQKEKLAFMSSRVQMLERRVLEVYKEAYES